jgi:hypothetical protein
MTILPYYFFTHNVDGINHFINLNCYLIELNLIDLIDIDCNFIDYPFYPLHYFI